VKKPKKSISAPFLPGLNFFMSKLSLGPFKPIVGLNAKSRSNSIAKTLGFLHWLGSSLTHNFYLSLLITYLVVHPIYVIASTWNDPPTLKCPDQYAFEVKPNIYVRCEDYDKYWDLEPNNRHLTMEYMNGK